MHSILLISPEPWDGHFVSKHHYAVTLAQQGYEVYFLGSPDASLSKSVVEKTKCGHVWSVRSPLVAKGLRFYPAFVRRWLEARWLVKFEKQIGKKFSTIWLFENSRFYDMGFAGRRTKIYHQVDLNQNFHVAKAASTADICFCTTDFIRHQLKVYNKNTYKIHHGVAEPLESIPLSAEQNSYFLENGINVVYVGNLDIPYLDIELLCGLVEQFPDVQFQLVGNYSETGLIYQRCAHKVNITWWGAVPSPQIPAILSHSDIQLLAYKVNSEWEIEQMASPHKVMEYLASGKVIVATYTDEYKDKPELLEMVDSADKFIDKFNDVVANLDKYNSMDRQKGRVAFAKENTYSKQLHRIITILNEHNLKL